MKRAVLLFSTALALIACGSSESSGSSGATTSAATSSGAGGGVGGSGGSGGSSGSGGTVPTQLDVIGADLQGDFDNSTQHAMSGGKLVERHVCPIPGRDGDASVLWLYVEQVEDTSGKRDAYSTRVNEIKLVMGKPVLRLYKLAATHPLATDPYKFNGPRDGCTKPNVLKTLTDADLLYRSGCDVTFAPSGDGFDAATANNTCAVPGGFINTQAVVKEGELITTDSFFDAASMMTQALSSFELRRVIKAP